jgi:hypothetical protein
MARLALRPSALSTNHDGDMGVYRTAAISKLQLMADTVESGPTCAKSQSGKTRHILCFSFLFAVGDSGSPRGIGWTLGRVL